MLRPYRILAAVPHAPALMLTLLVGRLQLPALPLVMTFLIADWTGSYAVAGTVAAAITIGQGIAGPLRGRAADRSSPPKLVAITALCQALGLCALTFLASGPIPAQWWWLILPVAAATGLATPPVSQIGRAMWPRVAPPEAQTAAYAVEATLQELTFIIAPVLAASAVAIYSPVVAMLGLATVALVGPMLFAATLWRAGLRGPDATSDRTDRRPATLFQTPGFSLLLCYYLLFVGGMIGTDLLLVGWARDEGRPELAGILAAVWAGGSLIGGLALGGASKAPRLWLRTSLAALGVFALVPALPPITDPTSPWLLGTVLLLAGTAVAPSLAAANGRLSDIAPSHRRAEAFGWMSTAVTFGSAVASPVVGALLDLAGPATAAAVAGLMAAVAALLVTHHSVRGSHASADTGESAVT